MTESSNYDLFIVYADENADWVEGFLIPAIGVPPERILTKEGFHPGEDKVTAFERAVMQSRYTLLILSPAFFADVWVMYGQSIAAYARVKDQSDRLLPLIRTSCQLPPHLDALISLDCTHETGVQGEVERLRQLLNQPEPTVTPLPCPYPGMMPFSEANSDRFFGRDREIKALVERLRLSPFITVIGPSGSGKSSLVFAGLIPALRRSQLFGSGTWVVTAMRPGETPMTTLNSTLGNGAGNPVQAVKDVLAVHPDAERLLLVIDQFEELFTFGGQEVHAFQHAVQHLIDTPNCFVVLTVRADFYADVMASPLWQQIQSHRMEVLPLDVDNLREAIVRPAEHVGGFIETALVERLIADAAGEPGILPFIQETLVLLWERIEQHHLSLRAYEALGEESLTGLQVAIARRADAALIELSESQQAIARRILLRLIQFGEGRPDTRRQQTVTHLRSADDDRQEFDRTLEHLVSTRLLTRSGAEGDEDASVDIAHEVLISGWPTLQNWLAERRKAEQTRRQLEAKVSDWERLDRKGGLLDEIELREAQEWLASPEAEELGYSKKLAELVRISREAITNELKQVRETARKLRNRLSIAVTLLVLAISAALGAYYYYDQATEKTRIAEQNKQEAKRQQQIAEEQREITFAGKLAVQAELIKEQSPNRLQRSILLAVSAMQRFPSIQAEQTLRFGLSILPIPGISIRHKSFVNAVDFSPDGRYLATASDDHTARILNVATGQEMFSLQHNSSVWSVAFGMDGKYLFTTSWYSKGGIGTISVWDVASGQRANSIEYEKGTYDIITAFSPDRRWMVTALDVVSDTRKTRDGSGYLSQFSLGGQRNLIRFIDTTTGREVPDLLLYTTTDVGAITFSPNGKHLAFAVNSTVFILELNTFTEIAKLNHEDKVNAAAFSPNSEYIAIAFGTKGKVKIWKIADTKEFINLVHDDKVTIVTFSPDGEYLVTADKEGTVKIGDGVNYREVININHEDYVNSVVFSPDGKYVATSSDDRTASILDIRSKREITRVVHEEAIRHIAFSFDGKLLATASDDYTARIWKLSSHQEANFIPTSKLNAAVFSPDGKCIAIINDNSVVHVVDVNNGRKIGHVRYKGKMSNKDCVSLSIDGKYLAAIVDIDVDTERAKDIGIEMKQIMERMEQIEQNGEKMELLKAMGESFDKAVVKVWQVSSGKEIISIEQANDVCSIALSPDGKFLASGCDQKATYGKMEGIQTDRSSDVINPYARVFEVSNGHEIAKKNYTNGVESLAFSHDGQYLAIATPEGMVAIWRGVSFEQQVSSIPHERGVHSMAFSPNGKYLATASNDDIIRIWEIRGKTTVAHIPHLGQVDTVSFSSDGRYILTLGKNHPLQMWSWKPEDLIEEACTRLTRNLTYDEWKQYIPDEPYTEVCKNLPKYQGAN